MFVLVEAGRFLYGDLLVDLIVSLLYPDHNLHLQVGLSRTEGTGSFVGLVGGMTMGIVLVIVALLFLLASALFIPLPYEVCDRPKVMFFEFVLRLSNEYLGDLIEMIIGVPMRNRWTRFVAGVPYYFPQSQPKWCKIRNETIGGCRCRVYLPNETKRKSNGLIIFIHGGGWCIMKPRYYDGPMLSLISRTGTPIISVDYQLAPEKRFPFAIDECQSLITELYENKYKEYGIDREKISVMGDSAGGNLTAVLCQRFRRLQKDYIKCQVLVYPVIHGLDFLAPSYQYYYRSYKGTALLNPTSLVRWYLLYLGIEPSRKNIKLCLKNRHLPKSLTESQKYREILDYYAHLPESFVGKDKYTKTMPIQPDENLSKQIGTLLENPDLCPILADDMSGLPPALILTAGIDILRDEGIVYARRLRKFGVSAKWNHYESAFHGVMNMPGSKQRTQILNDIHSHLSELRLL